MSGETALNGNRYTPQASGGQPEPSPHADQAHGASRESPSTASPSAQFDLFDNDETDQADSIVPNSRLEGPQLHDVSLASFHGQPTSSEFSVKPVALSINVPRTRRPQSTASNDNYLTPTTSNTSSSLMSTSSTPSGITGASLPHTSHSNTFKNLEDILKFPIESSYAYSYAHLSPNSLALRLNVLKRSLEILKDRPELFNSYSLRKTSKDEDDQPASKRLSIASLNSNNSACSNDSKHLAQPTKSIYNHANNSSEYFNDNNKKYKLQSNASSAALAALLRPQVRRSDSFPVNQVYGGGKDETDKRLLSLNISPSPTPAADSFLNDDLKDLITLLENDRDLLSKNTEIATTLHHLSLSTNKEAQQSIQKNLKTEALKNKLLYALATPFVETSVLTSSLLQSGVATGGTPTSLSSSLSHQSTAALNMLASSSGVNAAVGNNARPFHQISSGKHSMPQSVFTVEIDNPWSVKAANDLACLMFGVSNNTIKNLTLMDLIAPQFRNFVTERLTNYISGNLDLSLRARRSRDAEQITNNNILFAGEIVAILRPGDQNFAWTSMWAKRKGNFIICMFDQIPCDAFDVVISCKKEGYNQSPSTVTSTGSSSVNSYNIDSVNEIAGNLVSSFDVSKILTLGDISESLEREVGHEPKTHQRNDSIVSQDTEPEEYDEFLDYYVSPDVTDSEKINKTRYYTVQFKSEENIPCAITSNPLEVNDNNYEIKLKIHSLPYIAGLFVIDSSNYNILSCNNAIARNLFGKSSEELNAKSINTLIPNFTKILNMGLKDNSNNFDLIPGLVLPEHFFRKYDSIMRFQNGEQKGQTEEELFFHSHGVKALHRDGKYIFVDVQLRASSNETLVVWITYSRSSNKSNISSELDKLDSKSNYINFKPKAHIINDIPEESNKLKDPPNILVDLIGNARHARSATNRATGVGAESSAGVSTPNGPGINWPSQLNLIPQKTPDSVDFDASSDIARKSSTRKARNDSFGIPVSFLNSTTFDRKPRALTKLYKSNNVSSESVSKVVPDEEEDEVATDLSAPNSAATDATSHDSNANSIEPQVLLPEYTKFSEEEILKFETEQIEEKKAKSTHWPSEVGTKRRTKKFSEFEVLKDMGEGAYGKVVLAQHKEDPVYKIIIKCIDKERILVDTWVRDRNLGTIPSEIQIMAFLNNEPHPNIMKIIDFFEDRKYYYLETPIFGDPPAIDLFDYIEIKKNMTELECQFIFKQVVSTIYHLHKNGIVHRDIKDENVIVDESGIIKLIDFGSAAYTRQGPFDVFVGTIDYASPEVLRGEKYEGKPQDIWALGILLYTMLYKENPFYNVDEIMEGDLRIPYVISEGSTDLVRKILIRDVDMRPTITDIVESDWLML